MCLNEHAVLRVGLTKFGADIGKASLLRKYVVDFRYFALFRNEGDSSANFGEKLKPNFAFFSPSPVKIRGGTKMTDDGGGGDNDDDNNDN